MYYYLLFNSSLMNVTNAADNKAIDNKCISVLLYGSVLYIITHALLYNSTLSMLVMMQTYYWILLFLDIVITIYFITILGNSSVTSTLAPQRQHNTASISEVQKQMNNITEHLMRKKQQQPMGCNVGEITPQSIADWRNNGGLGGIKGRSPAIPPGERSHPQSLGGMGERSHPQQQPMGGNGGVMTPPSPADWRNNGSIGGLRPAIPSGNSLVELDIETSVPTIDIDGYDIEEYVTQQ
jgi:hypothetical protein